MSEATLPRHLHQRLARMALQAGPFGPEETFAQLAQPWLEAGSCRWLAWLSPADPARHTRFVAAPSPAIPSGTVRTSLDRAAFSPVQSAAFHRPAEALDERLRAISEDGVAFVPAAGHPDGAWLAAGLCAPLSGAFLEALEDSAATLALALELATVRERERSLHATPPGTEEDDHRALVRLVAGVAHELGGPLQAITGLAKVLESNPSREEVEAISRRVTRSALRCRSMVQELLALGGEGELELSAVDVTTCILDALELERFSDDREVRVAIDSSQALSPPVLAEERRLTQVLLNLLANARCAIAEGGRPGIVRVHCRSNPEHPERLDVLVDDEGPGVPDALREHLFSPWVSGRVDRGGHGLGLYVSRLLARRMGGELVLDDPPSGGGARFRLTLDRAPTASAPAKGATEQEDEQGASELAILVVDDDRELLETYCSVLALTGHRVESACTGAEGQARLDAGPFDVILVDMRLPDMSGEAFFRELAEADQQRVVFATGDVLNEGTRRFLVGTGRPYLVKPFRIEELEETLRRGAGGPCQMAE